MSNSNTHRLDRSGHLEWVALGLTKVSPAAQRELRQHRVDKLVGEFDPDRIGIPIVSLRGDFYYIIDGQHRIAAAVQWFGEGWETQKLQCWVYRDLTEADEADLFDRHNDVLTIPAYEKFKVRVTAGRPVESDVLRTVRAQGCTVARGPGVPGAISCPGTLVRIYQRSDADTLGRAIRIAYSFGEAGLDAAVLDGIAHLCQRYNGLLDEKVAIERLGSIKGGIGALLTKAEVLRKTTGNRRAMCVAAAAVEFINASRGGKKLPSWWAS